VSVDIALAVTPAEKQYLIGLDMRKYAVHPSSHMNDAAANCWSGEHD
jgi:hypothetical protein